MRASGQDGSTLALVTSLCQEQKPPKGILLDESWHLSGLKENSLQPQLALRRRLALWMLCDREQIS